MKSSSRPLSLSQVFLRHRRAGLWVIILTAFISGLSARAASVDSLFQSPVLTLAGAPQRVLVLPDDSFLAHYDFDRFDGADIGPLVKFKADGTRDSAFRMGGHYFHVLAVAPTADGRFYVAARELNKIGTRYLVLRVNSDGSLDAGFNAGSGANGPIYSLTVQPDGNILVGGSFKTFNGEDRPCLVRLTLDGSVDSAFAKVSLDNFPTSGIYSNIIVQPDKKIVFAGEFVVVNGQDRLDVARLHSDGTLDATFAPTGYSLSSLPVHTIALQPDGKILVGARFTVNGIFGTTRGPLMRLNADGSLHQLFVVQAGASAQPFIQSIKLLANGDIIGVGTRFFRFTTDGTVVAGYQDKNFSPPARSVDVQSDGKILVAGMLSINSMSANGLVRFNTDGSGGTAIAGQFQREIFPRELAVRSDGKIWLNGIHFFDRVDGLARPGLARLKANGEVDSFDPQSLNVPGSDLALHPNDKILLRQIPGTIIRLNPNDTLDGSLPPSSPGFLEFVAAPQEQYIALNNYSAQAVADNNVIKRLLSDGSIDPSFQFGVDFSQVAATHTPPASHFWVGDNRPLVFYEDGRFLARYFDATGNYHLRRFNSDGSLDPNFLGGDVPALNQRGTQQNVSFNNTFGPYDVTIAPGTPLSDALLLTDGKIIVVGMFDHYNGTAAPSIVRLQANGAIDITFKAGAGAQWTSTPVDATHIPRIDAIEPLADGRFLIAGNFEAYDGAAAPGIARLNADGSRDHTFFSPVALANTYSTYPTYAFSPVSIPDFPASQLVTQPDGSILLSGNYSQTGSDTVRSLFRINGLTATAPLNISTRMRVETGENVLIGGFIITGNAPKKVIVRAIGPSLTALGVPGALANPTLELRGAGAVLLASNDDWRLGQQSEIQNSGLAPQNDLESAIITTLAPGGYTAIVAGHNGTTGAGLLEIYDLSPASDSELANISTRGLVQTGNDVMIGGFILGNSAGATRVLIRAAGPSLTGLGISGALQDPTLELFDGNGARLLTNDNWKETQRDQIEATGIPPSHDAESAIVAQLTAGNYTAIVSGKSNTTGVALVEVYNVK